MIYFDLDGVLADWVAGYERSVSVPLSHFNELDKERRDYVKSWLFNYDFFRQLPVLEKGLELFNLAVKLYGAENVQILSAYGDHNVEEVIRAKMDWVTEHLGSDVVVNLVPKLEDKVIYANPEALLIDDRERAVESFNDAGGKALLFDPLVDDVNNILRLYLAA